MYLKKHLTWLLVFLSAGLLSACATKVNRIGANETKDLSGEWNDTDSQQMAANIVRKMDRMPWLTEFTQKKGKKPILVVEGIENRTSEHIDTETFIADIEAAVVNGRRMSVVASSAYRSSIRGQRREQDTYASPTTRKQMGRELGADVIVLGTLKAINDYEGKKSVRYYQLDVSLINIETNEVLWIGQSKIKKYVTGKHFRK